MKHGVFISLGVQGDSEISIFQFLSCWRVSCNHIFYSIETFSVALYCMKLETSAQLSPGHQISVSYRIFDLEFERRLMSSEAYE